MGETILNLKPKPDPFEEDDGSSRNSANSTQSVTENETGKPEKSREPEKLFMMSLFLSGLRRLYKQPERNKERPWTTDKDPIAEDPSQVFENEAPADDLDKLFENFLDSLVQICSFNDKAYLVTAVLVQQTSAGPVFHVTRNGMDHKGNGKDGEILERFLSVVLNLIRGIREQTAEKFLDVRRKPFARLLQKIVDDNHDHVKYYADRLRRFVGQYLDDMTMKKRPAEVHKTVQSMIEAAKNKDYFNLILGAEAAYLHLRGNIGGQGESNGSGPWNDVRHFTGRLRSYYKCLKYFYHASRVFPGLFQDFEVHFLSPKPAEILHYSWEEESVKRSFANIKHLLHGRWTDSDVKLLWAEIEEVVAANRRGMSDDTSDTRCWVHAEVALVHWFWKTHMSRNAAGAGNDDDIEVKKQKRQLQMKEHGRVFFEGRPYVGTSKSCCPLCAELLRVHPSGIRGRKPHSNVYSKWMVPGGGAEAGRCEVHDAEVRFLNIAIQDYCHDQVMCYLLPGPQHAPPVNGYDSEDDYSD